MTVAASRLKVLLKRTRACWWTYGPTGFGDRSLAQLERTASVSQIKWNRDDLRETIIAFGSEKGRDRLIESKT